MIKNKKQLYYYYYGGGSWEGNRQTNFSKESDLVDLTKLLEASTKFVFQLAKNDLSVQKATALNKAKQEVDLLGWADDIEIVAKKEIRDLKMGILPEDDFQGFWRGMDGAGLNGIQLRSKIAVWWNLLHELGIESVDFDGFKKKIHSFFEKKFNYRKLVDMLSYVKSILGSISNFFAPGLMDSINELIDFLLQIANKD